MGEKTRRDGEGGISATISKRRAKIFPYPDFACTTNSIVPHFKFTRIHFFNAMSISNLYHIHNSLLHIKDIKRIITVFTYNLTAILIYYATFKNMKLNFDFNSNS